MNIMQLSKTLKAKVASFFGKKPPITPKKQVFAVESKPVAFEPDRVRPTKAYADGRQKARRNRKRKPSKALKNLYHL